MAQFSVNAQRFDPYKNFKFRIKWDGKYLLAVRGEGNDRKSFFAIAESPNGVDNFRFWERPVTMPETDDPDINPIQ